MQISRGIIQSAQKIIIYGTEGIGKSTFASKFPDPLFIDTEGSTKHMDVKRTPKPSSWTMLLEQIKYIKNNPDICRTLVIDTADWAEKLCIADICAKAQKTGIEDFGYGKGYIYLVEEFGRFLNHLSDVIDVGIHVVITAHAAMRKFEQPDELGAYDRWELKLEKKTAPLVKEWADMVLFANYKTYVINVDNQGAAKGKNKAQGGTRVMYTAHHPCWDAKNRHNLQSELNFDYSEIKNCVKSGVTQPKAEAEPTPVAVPIKKAEEPIPAVVPEITPEAPPVEEIKADGPAKPKTKSKYGDKLPKALIDLMEKENVIEYEIQEVVAKKGYYPADTPIENYDQRFISGVLISAWAQVFKMIKEARENDLPFNIKEDK